MEILPEPYGTKPLTSTQVIVKDDSAELKKYPELYEAGSEPVADNEMRITALGTGYPSRRGQGCGQPRSRQRVGTVVSNRCESCWWRDARPANNASKR